MQQSWKNIVIIILTIILIPAMLITVFQISSLNDYEEELQGVFRKQLDAILFSVNQYSQDAVGRWVEEILEATETNSSSPDFNSLSRSINQNPNNLMVLIFDGITDKLIKIVSDSSSFGIYGTKEEISKYLELKKLIEGNSENIQRLLQYKKSNYTKIEPIVFSDSTHDVSLFYRSITPLAFISGRQEKDYRLILLLVDNDVFLKRVVIPKIESTLHEELIISVISKDRGEAIYSTDKYMADEVIIKKPIWINPSYSIAVSQYGDSFEEIIRGRRTWLLSIVLFFDFCLIIAVWLIISYVKKEEALSRHKSDFISNVSHELRTPLSLVKMYTESLEMGRVKDDNKRNEYYRIINSETDRLTRIVNKILNFSRMEAGKRKFNLIEGNINEIVSKVCEAFTLHMQEKEFSFICKLDDSIPAIHFDYESAEEALINLIDNAQKYSAENKKIIVSTGREGEFVFVSVADKGIGISKEEKNKIFEKFFRVSTGLTHNTKGSGLGLALVKYIMAGHNGTVRVESIPGEGSTFTVLFPLKNAKVS